MRLDAEETSSLGAGGPIRNRESIGPRAYPAAHARLAMQGVPLPVIARQLGHADTRMIERHYAHLSLSYVADTVRADFPKLGIVEPSNARNISGDKR